MKRLLSLLTLMVLVLGFNCKKKNQTVPLAGIISFIVGEVHLLNYKGDVRKADVGDKIFQGMKIETVGKKSCADVYIGDYCIKILGNSKIDIQKLFFNLTGKGNVVRLSVENGRLFSKITTKLSKVDKYEVRTLTAVIAVRGTEFLVTEDEGKTNVACLEGFVEVINISLKEDNILQLNPDEEVTVISAEGMVKKQISADKLRMLDTMLEIKTISSDICKKFKDYRQELEAGESGAHEVEIGSGIEKDKVSVEEQKKVHKANDDAIKDKTEDKAK